MAACAAVDGGRDWLRAVEDTAGRALLEGGRPIMASYSSTANGPRAMSQNGALEMANAGRSASEILATYYGLRPTLAPAKLPAAIKVAVEIKGDLAARPERPARARARAFARSLCPLSFLVFSRTRRLLISIPLSHSLSPL